MDKNLLIFLIFVSKGEVKREDNLESVETSQRPDLQMSCFSERQ